MKIRIFLVMLVLGTALQSATQNQQPPTVKRPYRIAVIWNGGTMGPETDELVRSKLISSLSRQCGSTCMVVEHSVDGSDTAEVDAVLTGIARIEQPCYDCEYRMQGAVRMVARDGKVLWSDTVYSSWLKRSVTSSFADNVAKKLVKHLASKTLAASGE